ncbi:MAG: hypothetical protein Rpha_1299 [Candidatus Ruthia sp. Apha_13_S6]|nr:hypothetical protein [Candidatus Ruthia sp. Apha_13_S6]
MFIKDCRLGCDYFIANLGKMVGRDLRFKSVGRRLEKGSA